MKRIFLILLLVIVSSLMAQEGETVPFRSDRSIYWGYKNQATGEVIVEPIYQEAEEFDNGLARVKKSGKWGIINPQGQEILSLDYSAIEDFSTKLNGMTRIKKGGKGGIN